MYSYISGTFESFRTLLKRNKGLFRLLVNMDYSCLAMFILVVVFCANEQWIAVFSLFLG